MIVPSFSFMGLRVEGTSTPTGVLGRYWLLCIYGQELKRFIFPFRRLVVQERGERQTGGERRTDLELTLRPPSCR